MILEAFTSVLTINVVDPTPSVSGCRV